ncbi:MAG: hypothetical protein QOD72_274 [Acidimicrobiaceae bacterium]|nr:hypothetical protein [Acidimicrobiaceae bacterium]
MERVSRILLVGGSSRIPLAGLLVREMTERPVTVDAHPKLAIATWALETSSRCRALMASTADDAERCFERSFAHDDRLAAPFELARTLLCRAERRVAMGSPLDPSADLVEAIAIFDGLGAVSWSAQGCALRDSVATRDGPQAKDLLSPAGTTRRRGSRGGDVQPRGGRQPLRQRENGGVPPPQRLSQARYQLAHPARSTALTLATSRSWMTERCDDAPVSTAATTGEFEFDRQRHLRAFADRLPEEADRLTWPLERLHGLRDERLRALLRTAKAHSSWHRRRLAGIDADTATGADVATLPTMTKADVMEHWDEIVTDPRLTLELAENHLERVASEGPAYLLDVYQVVTTGGSTGRRGVFAWDFEGWLSYGLVRERSTFWLQQRAGAGEARRAFVAASHATHPTFLLARTFSGSPQLGVSRSFPVTLPFDEIVGGLNQFQPTDLFSYTSMMHRLAIEKRHGGLRISPRELNCAAEPLGPETRADIEDAFGCPLLNLYAATEVGVIARSFPNSTGLHLNEDIAVFEPVDTDNRPVPIGTRAAKLLVTNVINHVMPLIRYELTDQVTFLDQPTPDPWTGRRIADIEGRLDDMFVYDGHIEVHPHLFRSALGRRRQIFEYQVRQTVAGAEVAVRTSTDFDTEALRRELTEGLAALGVNAPQVTLAVVNEIERAQATGKLRRFIPLVVERR